MWRDKKIAVVVPAYCEERFIAETLRTCPLWVDRLIVVDDASPDATFDVATKAARQEQVVLRHSTNRGVGASIVTGYRYALDEGMDVLAVMAGDGQMHPLDLEAVVAPVCEGVAGYVKGNRFAHPLWRAMPTHRRWGGRFLALATRRATGLSVTDTQCGYTALSAEAARRLPLEALWPRYGYPNDLLGMLAARQIKVTEVPVRPVYRDERSGIRPWHALTICGLIARRWYLERQAWVG